MRGGRRWLYGALAAGLIGLGAGGGTFATFNAQTTNPGNTFSTGSLTLTDAANAGTACFSFDGSANKNSTGCAAIVSVGDSSQYPGAPIVTGAVQLTNGGTLDPKSLDLSAPSATDCVDAYGPLRQATNVTITNGVTSAGTFTDVQDGDGVSGTDIPPGTTVSSTSGSGSTETLTLSHTSINVATGEILSFSIGSLNLDTGTTPKLCGATVAYVEEVAQTTTGGSTTYDQRCVWGGCGSLTIDKLATQVTAGPVTAITVTNGFTYAKGDEIEVTNASGQSKIFTTTSAGTSTGAATPIEVTSATTTDTFGVGSAVVDLSSLPSDATDTLSSFDSTTGGSSGTPVSISAPAGWTGSTSPLPAGSTRTFEVGLYIPSQSSQDNTFQDLTSTFGLTWSVEQ